LKDQILRQGKIDGKKTAQKADLYANVNIQHLKKLKSKNKMTDYMMYTQ